MINEYNKYIMTIGYRINNSMIWQNSRHR